MQQARSLAVPMHISMFLVRNTSSGFVGALLSTSRSVDLAMKAKARVVFGQARRLTQDLSLRLAGPVKMPPPASDLELKMAFGIRPWTPAVELRSSLYCNNQDCGPRWIGRYAELAQERYETTSGSFSNCT
jgi:hypothetical protein